MSWSWKSWFWRYAVVYKLCKTVLFVFPIRNILWMPKSSAKSTFLFLRSLLIWREIWGLGILLPKLFWPTVRKNCYSYREKNFEIWGWRLRIHKIFEITKGQLISKAIHGQLTSPKKRTDEFDLFAMKSKKANKSNSFVRFLGEVRGRPPLIDEF